MPGSAGSIFTAPNVLFHSPAALRGSIGCDCGGWAFQAPAGCGGGVLWRELADAASTAMAAARSRVRSAAERVIGHRLPPGRLPSPALGVNVPVAVTSATGPIAQ